MPVLARHVVERDAQHAGGVDRHLVAEDARGVRLDLLVAQRDELVHRLLLDNLYDGLLALPRRVEDYRDRGRHHERRDNPQDVRHRRARAARRTPVRPRRLLLSVLRRQALHRAAAAEPEVHRAARRHHARRRHGRRGSGRRLRGLALSYDGDGGRADLDRVAHLELARLRAELLAVHERPVRAREVGEAQARLARPLEKAVVAGKLLVGEVHVVRGGPAEPRPPYCHLEARSLHRTRRYQQFWSFRHVFFRSLLLQHSLHRLREDRAEEDDEYRRKYA